VRARLASAPEKYRWSSYRSKIGLDKLSWLDADPCYRGLGQTVKEREKQYGNWIKESIPEAEWELIRKAVQRGQLTGRTKFIEEVSRRMGVRVEIRGQGRPKK